MKEMHDSVHSGANPHRLNAALAVAPLDLSLVAMALVLGNVAAGVPRQSDEGSAAHLFQLSIAVQFPLVLLFLLTSRGEKLSRTVAILGVQALAVAAALGSLAWSGY